MTARLSLRGATAGYGDGPPVIRDVTLEVGPGEVVALLGANGAGKTTTLRAISGLLKLSAGSALLDHQPLDGLSADTRARHGIAHVIEGRGVFFGLTVAEHLRLSPRGARVDPEIAYAAFPKLATVKDRRAGDLSGGEQQMLAVGRAFARRPSLLLVDELSLGLAPIVVQQLLPAVREFATSTGAGVLLVEQHVQLALSVSDRGYVMSRGVLAASGSAETLSADRHLIEASYLGDEL